MAYNKAQDNNPTVAFLNVTPIDANDKEYPGRIKGIALKGNSAFEKALIANAKENPDMEIRIVGRVHILDNNATSEFVFEGSTAPAPVAAVETPVVEEVVPAATVPEDTSIPF